MTHWSLTPSGPRGSPLTAETFISTVKNGYLYQITPQTGSAGKLSTTALTSATTVSGAKDITPNYSGSPYRNMAKAQALVNFGDVGAPDKKSFFVGWN